MREDILEKFKVKDLENKITFQSIVEEAIEFLNFQKETEESQPEPSSQDEYQKIINNLRRSS